MTSKHRLRSVLRIEVTCADIPLLIKRITDAGIALYSITQIDLLTVSIEIQRRDYNAFCIMLRNSGATFKITKSSGIYWYIKRFSARPVLLWGLALVLMMTMFLPGRVLFVSVDGNTTISAKLIIEKAEECGISFGALRRTVRSEQVKNELLSALPQLQWAGVNTYGCVAVISVSERAIAQEEPSNNEISSIIATRDGIIQSCTVTRGNALCKTGQAVKAGELLVSGYTDCGLLIRAVKAEAEIYALTERKINVISPIEYAMKATPLGTISKYSLKIGKNRINFYKGSGILDASCDKMYKEYYLTLPGGFQLPVALVVQTWITHGGTVSDVSAESDALYLRDFAKEYLISQMVGGAIINESRCDEYIDGTWSLSGEYLCLEMIGQAQSEEIIGNNGKTD